MTCCDSMEFDSTWELYMIPRSEMRLNTSEAFKARNANGFSIKVVSLYVKTECYGIWKMDSRCARMGDVRAYRRHTGIFFHLKAGKAC